MQIFKLPGKHEGVWKSQIQFPEEEDKIEPKSPSTRTLRSDDTISHIHQIKIISLQWEAEKKRNRAMVKLPNWLFSVGWGT